MAEQSFQSFEHILIEAGDFGPFQLLLYLGIDIIVFTPVTWSMVLMEYSGAIPDYQCIVYTLNGTANVTLSNVCDINGTSCDIKVFNEEMKTVVSEWGLVCDRKWITQSITTIQMAGLLVGSIVFGHMSDTYGRKPTLFISVFVVAALNTLAYFSTGWIMLAVLLFFIGMGCSGAMLSIISFEYIRNDVRIWLNVIPGWTTASALLVLFCWRVHNWKLIHVTIGAMCLLCAPFWFIFPESFRWLLSKGRFEEAQKIVVKVARINGRPIPNMGQWKDLTQKSTQKQERYSLVDLLRRKPLRKITILFSLIWLFSAFTYYGIAFGVQELSGNFYLNLILVSVMDFPGNVLLAIINPCFGRKWSSLSLYLGAGVLALLVGLGKTLSFSNVGTTLDVLALLSKLSVSAAWTMSTIWTNESFPTVARYIGTGFISAFSRLGSIVAPQIITASLDSHGLLYLVSGVVCILSSVLCLFLQETKGRELIDTIATDNNQPQQPNSSDGQPITEETKILQVQTDVTYRTFN